jgi:hypothetical protein
MNSTFEQNLTCLLLTDKLAKSTGNKQGRLDCSRHGSLAPALLYFMVNEDKLVPKASLHTFGMQLTCQH